MKFRTKQFFILLGAGMTGVISTLLIDVPALIALLPIPAGEEIPEITWGMMLLGVAQSGILLTIAIFVGVKLAHKVGLFSPLSSAIASQEKLWQALAPQLLPGILGGIIGGLTIVSALVILKPFWPPDVAVRIAELGKVLPLPTRVLAGGITEELLLRWGFMSLLVWGGWKLFQNSFERPTSVIYMLMIVISSLVFAAGHLPMAFLLFPDAGIALISYVFVANTSFGLIAGFLFWKKGLEASIIAHITVHLILFTSSYFLSN